jgi:class 3 adenylate cyclase
VRYCRHSCAHPVVHARQDLVVDVEHGRYLAAKIPGATLFEYDGEHLPVFVGVDETLDAIEEFVTGAVHRPAGDRVLATVVFTDIVGSTERAAALGDRDWKSLLDPRGGPGGIAVHIGARVAALASGGEVLVSGSVPPLVVGSGLDFADRGEHELKGVPGTWRLFAVTG